MIDREKVINGLEWCMNERHDCYREKGCPYENVGDDVGCKYALHRDALALLKSQAPKRESRAKVPCICGSRKRETWLGDAGWQFKCMKCGRRSPWGKTEKEAIQNWNKMIESMRVKQDGN